MSEWPEQPFTIGVGMPRLLRLEAFGVRLLEAFGATPYLVGSAAVSKNWRDVDVRLILGAAEYDRIVGEPRTPNRLNLRWALICDGVSALAQEQTGLPVDFQIQTEAQAAQYEDKARIPLGMRGI